MKPDAYFKHNSPEFEEIKNEILRFWHSYYPNNKHIIPDIRIVKFIPEIDKDDECVFYCTTYDTIMQHSSEKRII